MRAPFFAPSLALVLMACVSHVQLNERDRHAIVALEALWHTSADTALLDQALDDDFARPMANGDIWDKATQIAWVRQHPPPPGFDSRIDRLDVRFYADTAIATGVVTVRDPGGREVDRNVFTDVYVRRDGAWRLVNAQRTQVRPAA